jgi:ferrochelatase
VAAAANAPAHEVVYQSRSGSPSVPWLEPDVCDRLRELAAEDVTDVVIVPLGFVSDHVEVLYDLDDEARSVADELGLTMVRASTVGTHPRFVAGIRELVAERLDPEADRPALGPDGPSHDVCPVGCCLPGTGRPSPWDVAAPAA